MVNFHVFDVDQLPRRVLDRSWPILAAKRPQNDPNLAPQDDPKSAKNRVQKMINILIDKKTFLVIHFGRSGGMRWPPGGIIGGARNSLFEIGRYLRQIMALRFRVLGCDLARSASPLRGGRRIASPKGEHRRPPSHSLRRLG